MQQSHALTRKLPRPATLTDRTSNTNDVRPNLRELLQVPVGNATRNGEPCPMTRGLPAQ